MTSNQALEVLRHVWLNGGVQIVTVTPELAKDLLENNPNNRRIDRKTVVKYKHDLLSGNWRESNDAVVATKSGTLKNGQHRLTAIVESGVPCDLILRVTGDEAEPILDRGRPRTALQQFQMDGDIPAHLLSKKVISIVNAVFDVMGGDPKTRTDAEKKAFIKAYGNTLYDAYCVAMKGQHKTICTRAGAMTAIFFALHSGVNRHTLERFAVVVNTGYQDGPEESAAVTARNYMFDNPVSGGVSIRLLAENTEYAIEDFIKGKRRTRRYNLCGHPNGVYSRAFITNEGHRWQKKKEELT